MLDLKKQQTTPVTVIRAASGSELTEYEKNKLASVEDGAQQNKIEVIKLNGVRVPVDQETKTANINLNLQNLAFKSTITNKDIDDGSIFFIKCEL